MGIIERVLVTIVQVLAFLFGVFFAAQAYVLFSRADTIMQQVLAMLGAVASVGSFGAFAVVTLLLALHDQAARGGEPIKKGK